MEILTINMSLKIFTINMFIYFVFSKLINEHIIDIKKITISIIGSIVSTIVYISLERYVDHIFLIIINYFIQLILIKSIFVDKRISIIITNLIANAIVYLIFPLAATMEFVIKMVLNINNETLDLLIVLLIELIIILIFFKIRRFTKGLDFLYNKSNNEYIEIIMINISCFMIFLYCILGADQENMTKRIFITLAILSIIMIIMIQKTLTLYYKQKLLSKTIEDYKNELADKDEQIKKLSEEKYEISKLNHQFYNRQKALELKVQEVISDINIEAGNELAIVKQIDDLSKEYSKGLEGIKGLDKLPSTNVEEIDDMFKYMQAECKKNDIDFKLQINGNINHMINKIIQKNKLETLIGDHIRDAIIAINAGNNKFRSILTILGIKDDCYELCIYDSGVEFTIDTLLKLGIEPTTTHRDTGGSGIGFMTTFETMKETKASLIINEKSTPSVNDYTKAVTIRFDGKNEYRICSYREDKIKKKTKDNRIIICNQNRSI